VTAPTAPRHDRAVAGVIFNATPLRAETFSARVKMRDEVFGRPHLASTIVQIERLAMPQLMVETLPRMMANSKSRRKKAPKRVLALPDLEQAKTAVLNSLTSASGQRTYDHAIREFVSWYCSEPRLAFNRTVVLRYRIHLEQCAYAPATINLRLAAVRRIAYEAADAGLLSPELAAGIRRVKGVRRIGVRLGNWLTPEQGRRLLQFAIPSTPRELRITRWSRC
jgi:hypothetical protein